MISAWKKENPPPHRVKPVPIQVLRRMIFVATQSTCPLLKATADMIVLVFFFLLCPGEYTASSSETQPFAFQSVQLFIGGRRLSLTTASDAELLQSRFGSLTFDRQKNGVRGEVIGLGISKDSLLCPVRALGRRIVHLRSHNAPLTIPFTIKPNGQKSPQQVSPPPYETPSKSSGMIWAFSHQMSQLGVLVQRVQMRLDPDVIRLIDRWRSDEMLRYLHVQAAPLMSDYSRRMLSAGHFTLITNGSVPMH
jgi:hypothetical protein